MCYSYSDKMELNRWGKAFVQWTLKKEWKMVKKKDKKRSRKWHKKNINVWHNSNGNLIKKQGSKISKWHLSFRIPNYQFKNGVLTN